MADERLSDERLAQIRHRLSLADHARYAPNASLEGTRIADLYRRDVSALLAEVERLRLLLARIDEEAWPPDD